MCLGNTTTGRFPVYFISSDFWSAVPITWVTAIICWKTVKARQAARRRFMHCANEAESPRSWGKQSLAYNSSSVTRACKLDPQKPQFHLLQSLTWILSTCDYVTGSLWGQLYNDNYDSDTAYWIYTLCQKLCHYWISSCHWILKPTCRVVYLYAGSTYKCTHLSGLTNTKQFWCGVRWPSEKLSHAVSQLSLTLL